jgi:hypothetical protein
MKKSRILAAVATLVVSAAAPYAHAAVQYVQSPPLTKVVDAAVGPVAGGPVQVPIITWGGDIATVYANGNAKATNRASIFGKAGLTLNLVREDVFAKQVGAYMSGKSPYLRGTMGMINMAAEVASKDPRTKPVVVYQMTWSAGGDALVVKGGVNAARELKGKSVAVQAYGPHVDYLAKVLADAGLSMKDVNVKWVADITGSGNSPAAALREGTVDAAMVIIPDAMALTSNGTVGTGAEDSVKGARILLSTKTANKIIADVYAVRSDYLQSNRAAVESFVAGLAQGHDALKQLVANKAARAAEYKQTMGAAAQILLDSAQAVSDAEGMYADADFVGLAGNQGFFANPKNPRGFGQLNKEIGAAFGSIGLTSQASQLGHASLDYAKLGGGGSTGAVAGAPKAASSPPAETPRFDADKVAGIVAKRQAQGTLNQGELFSFEVLFQPNQDKFPAELYADAFKKVSSLAATYGGAVITVEGHSDPMAYLRARKEGASQVVLGRTQQSAKNLSLSRSVAVRDSIVAYAKSQGVSIDPSQFAVVGHGIAQPKSGMCSGEPCAPKSEQEWKSNMRVEFRIIQIEAEASAFKPL